MKRIPFEKKYHIRIIVLIFFIFIIFLLASMRLFNFQLVLGKEFLDVAQKNSDTTVPIVAARGEIVDRNLVPLTSNKAIFNIEFDYSFMEKGTENEIILKLINLFEKQQEEWNDELPITLEKPYKFLEGREADVKRLKKRIVVNSYATAEDCMENIFKDYKIKKYENTKGKCTHCGKKIENCDFVGYDEITSRKIAGVRYQMVLKDYSKKNRFVFAEDISPNTVSILREFKADFTGIDIVERSQRTYISGDVASHLIGSIGPIYSEELEYYKNKGYLINDKVGKSGIEKAAEDYLRGKNGLLRITKNSNGEIVDVVEEIPPEAGKTVKLTIDYEFQKEIQQILSDYIKEFNEKKVRPNKDPNEKPKFVEAGAVLVLDTTNNDVLASVSYPYYDINESYSTLVNREDNPLFNNALNGTFRPGSTFKPIVAA
ncbi:MAG: penicillin-binding transpeptidase domain-containing protein, partial [Oscillospiraceae bacterium]